MAEVGISTQNDLRQEIAALPRFEREAARRDAVKVDPRVVEARTEYESLLIKRQVMAAHPPGGEIEASIAQMKRQRGDLYLDGQNISAVSDELRQARDALEACTEARGALERQIDRTQARVRRVEEDVWLELAP